MNATWSHPGAGRRRLTVSAVALATAVPVGVLAARVDAAVPTPGTTITGRATFYSQGPNSGMNCSFPAGVPANDLYAAVGPDEWMASGGCGATLQVKGPKGSVRVMVTDKCPECEPGHLDLSQDAFAQLGDLSAGIIPISYEAVADPPLEGPLAVRVKEGASEFWIGFLVLNHGNALTSVELRASDGSWVPLQRTTYNYWLKADGAGPGPLTLRITDLQGHRTTVGGITLTPTVVQDTGVFMYSGTPVTTSPTASTTKTTKSKTTKSKTTKSKTTKTKSPKTKSPKTKTTKTKPTSTLAP